MSEISGFVKTVEDKFDWKDISSEEWRTYTFPGGETVTITSPAKLSTTSESGGHRIVDTMGYSHYIAPGWLKIEWTSDPPFSF